MKQVSKVVFAGAAVVALGMLGGCATETSQALPVQKVESASRPYAGVRAPIAVGKFDNRSAYMRGVFSDGVDRLGGQAKTILITHLQQTNRFNVLDRDNLDEIKREATLKNTVQKLKGADYVITGDVTEFGRQEVGDQQLFGILGRGKEHVAYAKVNLNVVNIATSEVVYSAGGTGEYKLSNRESSASAAPPTMTRRSTAGAGTGHAPGNDLLVTGIKAARGSQARNKAINNNGKFNKG
ncbi:Hypothetical exported protein [Ralstonia solanacearum UW551]|uniref:Hypothetical exported protein n=1 Tax=Ralstonia solanacearum (strain UW551) TaxID=342110 RepID=A0AB33VE36_RALSU|nr:CsgG/HfaB family protein [Ralstonia solanacearum]EAP73156.1 Hypothetical exported protein [Ralstonia solanacearum UW551]